MKPCNIFDTASNAFLEFVVAVDVVAVLAATVLVAIVVVADVATVVVAIVAVAATVFFLSVCGFSFHFLFVLNIKNGKSLNYKCIANQKS